MADIKNHQSVREANQAVAEAKAKRRRLADEQNALPQKMQEAALRNRAEKARAAREGGDVATVGGDEAVTHLQAREASLPFEVWAADCEVKQLEVAHLQAQARVCAELRPDAEAKLNDLAEQREQVNRDYAAARQELDSINGQDVSGFRINQVRDQLRDLEEKGPDA